MKARKLPSGNWRAYPCKTIDGKKIRKSFTAPTKADAEFLASEWIAKKKESEILPTVSEVIDRYLNSKKGILSPSTLKSYIFIAEAIKNDFRGIRAADMTTERVQNYINKLSLTKSPKTVRNYYAFLLPALEMIMPDVKYRITLPKKIPTLYNVPTEAELKSLLDNAGEEMRLAILLASVGTLRRGEVCALKHKDVNREDNSIFVHADMVTSPEGRWTYKPTPKNTTSIRRISLPPQIIEMIPEGQAEAFVVPLTPAAVTDRFCRLRDKVGLKCRFHDLRHYAVSFMHSIGIPDQYIQEMGGFKTDATLKAVYRNALSDKSKEFSQKRNEAISKALQNFSFS